MRDAIKDANELRRGAPLGSSFVRSKMSVPGVRRAKAALSSGCKPYSVLATWRATNYETPLSFAAAMGSVFPGAIHLGHQRWLTGPAGSYLTTSAFANPMQGRN
jgi:hypothetical protein